MSLPIVRRNRGTFVSVKFPFDVGTGLTLISDKHDVEQLSEDNWALFVRVDVPKLESSLRFKHSRDGKRKVPVQNRSLHFEMIVESHRTSRKGLVCLELYHKVDSRHIRKYASCALAVELRSEKGPKDELDCVLTRGANKNGEEEEIPTASSSTKESFHGPIRRHHRRASSRKIKYDEEEEEDDEEEEKEEKAEKEEKEEMLDLNNPTSTSTSHKPTSPKNPPSVIYPKEAEDDVYIPSEDEEEEEVNQTQQEEEVLPSSPALESNPTTAPTTPSFDFLDNELFNKNLFSFDNQTLDPLFSTDPFYSILS